jgi:hypothetical protein
MPYLLGGGGGGSGGWGEWGVGGEWGLFSEAINPTTFIMNDIKETLEGITSCRSREKYNPHFYRYTTMCMPVMN